MSNRVGTLRKRRYFNKSIDALYLVRATDLQRLILPLDKNEFVRFPLIQGFLPFSSQTSENHREGCVTNDTCANNKSVARSNSFCYLYRNPKAKGFSHSSIRLIHESNTLKYLCYNEISRFKNHTRCYSGFVRYEMNIVKFNNTSLYQHSPPTHKLQQSNVSTDRSLRALMDNTESVILDPKINHNEKTCELIKVLNIWLVSWKNHQEEDNNIVNPVIMLQWIDHLFDSTAVKPILQAYSVVLDAVVERDPFNDQQSFSNNSVVSKNRKMEDRAVFGESILQRVMNWYSLKGDDSNNLQLYHNHGNEMLGLGSSLDVLDHATIIVRIFHKVMRLYCLANKTKDAERLLKEMEGMHVSLQPTRDSYTIVLSAFAKQGKPREAEYILYRMLDRNIYPSKGNFESCLNAWITGANPVSGQRAELLLLKMEELYQRNKELPDNSDMIEIQPCIKIFARVIKAWVVSRSENAAPRAGAILQLMHNLDWVVPKSAMIQSYVEVMNAWSWSGKIEAPEECHAVLVDLAVKIGYENVPVASLQKMITALITAWARSGREDLSVHVQNLWNELEQQRESGGDLKYIKHWDASVYNALLHAYAKAGDGEKAEETLNGMLQQYQRNSKVGAARPDTKCFNSVILAWSRSRQPWSGRRAHKIFQQMLDLAEGSQDYTALGPDTVTINALLSSLAGTRSIEVARQGEKYLQHLKEIATKHEQSSFCRPTTVTYNAAIRLWSNVRHPEALESAQELFDEMNTMALAGDSHIKPDSNTFNVFLSVIKNSTLSETMKSLRIRQVKEQQRFLAEKLKRRR